jgi:acyl carrier protein phosphodiesterase
MLSSATALHQLWSLIIGVTADQLLIVGKVPTCISDRNINRGEWVAADFNRYRMCQARLSNQAITCMTLAEPKPVWLLDTYLSMKKPQTRLIWVRRQLSHPFLLDSYWDGYLKQKLHQLDTNENLQFVLCHFWDIIAAISIRRINELLFNRRWKCSTPSIAALKRTASDRAGRGPRRRSE